MSQSGYTFTKDEEDRMLFKGYEAPTQVKCGYCNNHFMVTKSTGKRTHSDNQSSLPK